MLRTAFLALLFSLSGVGPALAADMGEDGLHKQPWFSLTFKDISEDMADAREAGKRLAIVFEQKGCIYCDKMHKTVLSDPAIVDYVSEHFMVVQYNLFGDEEVIDLDGQSLTEKTAAEKWNILFTPTWIFLPEDADGSQSAIDAAVGTMPGAFGKGTFLDLFTWVYEKGYDEEEGFQRYHARMIEERRTATQSDTSND